MAIVETSIPRTLIGTNAIPTITNGVPVIKGFNFPANWATRLATSFWDTAGGFDLKILEGKVASRAAVQIEVGLAGPLWAGRMEVEGSVSAASMRLDVLLDDFKAGMLVGLDINPQFSLQIQAYSWVEHHHIGWHPRIWFTKSWRDVLNIEQDESYQLIPFMFLFAKAIESDVKDLSEVLPVVQIIIASLPSADSNMIQSASGITSYVSDPASDFDWIWEGLTMSPDIKLEWDLIEMAVAVAETAALIPPVTAAGEALTLTEKVTKWLRPKLGSGPVLGIVIDVHLKLSRLTGYGNSDHPGTLTTKNIRTEGAVIVADVDTGSDLAPHLDRLGVTFTHRAAISFEFGWHTSISWLKILSHDFQKIFQPNDLGLEIPISEQYRYELSNKIGQAGSAGDSAIEITLVETFFFHAA